MRKISRTQAKVLAYLADRSPAWVIRAGRVTTLEALERLDLAELRLGHYGWEARITPKGLDVIGTLGD